MGMRSDGVALMDLKSIHRADFIDAVEEAVSFRVAVAKQA